MENPEVLEERIVDTKEKKSHNLIVFNDDFNTFDHVIDSLVKVCKHQPLQAEQCTYIVHYQGKCEVKAGDYNVLEPMFTGLLDRGISAEIQ